MTSPAGPPADSRGYAGFGGTAAELTSRSSPWWPPARRARPGSPNVIVVLVDDLGFSDLSPFGAEIDTPYVQALADTGYRLTNYHSTPLCSPSRAALLTGLNPHRAGFAMVAHVDPGYPGYRMEIPDDVPTLAESFRAGGYATFMVGKWHLTAESRLHDGADKGSWPVQRGFDRYHGSMDGFTSLFHPHRLISDNGPAPDQQYPDGYYLTDALTDRAIEMINGLRAGDAAKPFFLYFAHQAVHGPVQAKAADIEKYRGRYDAGWHRMREERFRRQLAGGLFAEGTEISGSDPAGTLGVPPWDELSAEQRALYARHMEVYAAAVDAVDQSLGRLVEHLRLIGEYDNTIIVVTSDNGATGEGGIEGTRSYFSRFVNLPGLPAEWCPDVPRDLGLIGGPRVHGHYPRGWAHLSNTPFRYYKGHTHAGGVHVPFVLSWPAGLPRTQGDSGVRDQYAYVTDVAPTLLALAGVDRPAERGGRPVQDVDGVAFGHLLADRRQPSRHRAQYVECAGGRGYFEDGYKIIDASPPGAGDNWELYDIAADPAETTDLAAADPARVAAMAASWHRAAWLNTVFPLVDDPAALNTRPSTELALSRPVTIYPGTPVLERYRSSKLTTLRSFTVEAYLDHRPGDEGVIVAHGDQGGGYVLFAEDGELRLTYNAYGLPLRAAGPMPGPGPVTVTARFTALPEMRWDIDVRAGQDRVLGLAAVPQLLGMAPFTGISVGFDHGGPVDWDLHERRGVFRYRRGLLRVRYVPGEKAPYNPEIIAMVEEAARRAID
ncbi:arylsulfatase [Spongiactinospora gelatinilytica]|uniref:Arylsulfatase n=1 Tax=Spongiactinospora gelatinilytica TaxID=2666298 RepID=A0A2W2HD54_9ACTN|nr:arylsulfatase [Spongiactinospora gelatinilytica]PZG52869.1 arylsulfatase [Spongiactinospora gelatinilytica]